MLSNNPGDVTEPSRNGRRRFVVAAVVAVLAVAMAIRFALPRSVDYSAVHAFNLGDELQEDGHENRALTEMKKAVALKPGYFAAREALADLYDNAGDPADAMKTLEVGEQVAPADRKRYEVLLAQTCLLNRQYALAEQHYRIARQLDPTDRQTWMAWALVFEREGRWRAAHSAWERFLKVFPNDASGLRGLNRAERHGKPSPGKEK
ncbi:MAG: tetratricopeptide repeat protein [Armatimonadetes bacterium]|nr:tetratricopeptide repeat protein [Armatimonadota bacterium]MDE2206497.1 tetratricopeptide repeat protein [Armatimonadota bacterium]